MFVHLFFCVLDYSASYELILMKFFGVVSHARHGTRNSQLDFGGDPVHSDPVHTLDS